MDLLSENRWCLYMKRTTTLLFGLIVCFFLFSSSAFAANWNYDKNYNKYYAIDGDTFYYKGEKYRIIGIDTPEKGQAKYEQAKKRLNTLLSSGSVKIKKVGKDVYGRTLAKVSVKGKNVAETLKREGFQK